MRVFEVKRWEIVLPAKKKAKNKRVAKKKVAKKKIAKKKVTKKKTTKKKVVKTNRKIIWKGKSEDTGPEEE